MGPEPPGEARVQFMGNHDDQVDSTSQALDWHHRSGVLGNALGRGAVDSDEIGLTALDLLAK